MLAGFIDAGFLKAQGSRALRREIRQTQVNAKPLIAWLKKLAEERDREFLRAYWYDGEFDPSDSRYATQRKYFDAIHEVPGVQLRLGYLVERTPGWHHAVRQALRACGVALADFERHFSFKPDLIQKGVDALITLDLVSLTKSCSWAVLVAGDKDLVEAVWTAQDEGCRVLLALPSGAGVARELRRQADEMLMIPEDVLHDVLAARKPRKGEPASEPEPAAPAEAELAPAIEAR
ncbi:MAG TPA: NYN domain-containing protein [Candidatus Dormibacteraeota bacterium]|nr:NYN domain-containing protein [Candidatus Dormibacteraeota bacterium]